MVTRSALPSLVFLTVAATVGTGTESKVFSLPNSILLFGGSSSYYLVGSTGPEQIPIPRNPEGNPGPVAMPGLSLNGALVSSGFPVGNDSADRRWGIRASVGVYSVREKRWRTYGAFSQILTTAISRDGLRVAFMADDIESKSRSLYMLDLKTGVITKLKALVAVSLSWSPDSERLALDIPYAGAPKVAIYEIGSGSLHELKKGSFPAWSPSGDWIAYVSASEQEIRLTRPDGADDHVLKNVRNHLFGYRSFGLQPVWSPDGGHLLINVYRGEGNTQDVLLLDFSTGRAETKSRDGDPIMGWASKPEGEK